MILRSRNDGARSEPKQSLFHKRRAGFGHSGGQFGSGFSGTDFHFALKKNVTGVHARVNAHGSQAGACLSVGNNPIDGGSAAIFREQGSVEVDPPVLGNREKARRDNLSIRDDDDDVGSELLEELLYFLGSNILRLMHGKIRGDRDFLHGGDGKLPAAAARTVGLGNDGDDLK